jgi:uncharacterized integral membrane protein
MSETEVTSQVSPEMEQTALHRAKDRARSARWDLNIAVFLFAILILIIILATYTPVGLEGVASVAAVGLALVWLAGWRREKKLFLRFYKEETASLEQEQKKALRETVRQTVEETIEEKVQKALRLRWQ